jgi:toxin-antitoxin system PIN domain toxin
MIAIDTNVLVYAHRGESSFHQRAFDCVKLLAEGNKPWAIPVCCLHEFLAIVTNTKIFRPASTHAQALAQVDAWLASPHAHILHSGALHWQILSDLAHKAKLQGGQFHDARIAALCIENGVSALYSADRDFGRFKALKTINPLVD